MNKMVVLVSGVITNNQGQILLLRRGKNNKTNVGLWQLPEGKIEFGEQPETALKREVREETCLEIISQKILFPSSCLMEIQGKKYHLLRLVYKVRSKEDKICLDNDHDVYDWFYASEIQEMDQTIKGLKEIIERI